MTDSVIHIIYTDTRRVLEYRLHGSVMYKESCSCISIYNYIYSVLYIHVCVESPESKGVNRGPGTHDCLSWPTKTGQHGGENVPANF